MKAVIFDFDYTLGDSTEGILACLSYGLEKLGFPPAGREEMRRTIGLSLGPALEVLTGCNDPEKAKEFTRLFMEKADEVMVAKAELFPGSREVLRDLKNRGLKTGIVTTKASYRIWKILEKCAARELVDVVVGSNDVQNEKPHPESLFKASELLKVDLSDIIYVGDSAVDARCAASAHVKFAGVLTGTTARAELERYPHEYIAEDLPTLAKEWEC